MRAKIVQVYLVAFGNHLLCKFESAGACAQVHLPIEQGLEVLLDGSVRSSHI